MTDTENTLIPVAVTLEEVLASRERRAARQAEVLAEFGFPLVSVTIVQPGAIKDSADARFLMTEAQRVIVQGLRHKQYPVLWQWSGNYVTGPEALYCIQTSVQQLKTLCVELEDRHPLGRLWDLDVIDIDGVPVSRTTTGHMPRRCLVCSEHAHVCARARTHSSESLSEEISRRINAFKQSGQS